MGIFKISLRLEVILSFFLFLSFASCRSNKELTSGNSDQHKTPTPKLIQNKYAEILQVSPEKISNTALYEFINDWYGTPYKYGGKDKHGIDCSNFTSTLYQNIYKRKITGSSASIFDQCKVVSKKDLQEGDLVFFKIEKNEISHIGVYLMNNKFVHATTKKGVMINDLDEAYYLKYFFKAGRITEK